MTATTSTKTRLPAAEQMAKRTRFTFGPAYLNAVLAGVHKDQDKMVVHANTLGLGSPSELKKLQLETLRERLGAAILAANGDDTPVRAKK